MLYPMNSAPFDVEIFRTPPTCYRGVPFWSWNCRVTREQIAAQASAFRQMGMGGAMIHPRTGLDTPYLSDEYMALVDYAVTTLQNDDMHCWLYDEERFPSGTAGGLVTRDIRFRARYLLLTRKKRDDLCQSRAVFDTLVSRGEKPSGYYLCSYHILFNSGRLASYARTQDEGDYYAYVRLMDESPWFNGGAYLDVMNPDAVDRFLALTHARYAATLGHALGKNVPAIFTDEPHMKGKHTLPTAECGDDATLAYTDDMNETFANRYGVELLDVLPELVWELPHGFSQRRYQYHEHVTERFASAYGDRIGAWCTAHGIAYTGHFLSERTLYSQTLALGETMRQYRSEHLPGVDILAGQLELTTLKQGESVRRQMGRESLVCELYGVLEWDVTFLQHKLQGDWLAALGVTTRVHHLAYMSMGGEAKRDWPAAIGWQSPWWKEYPLLEDYFARVNTLLTRGKPLVHVAVVHPIESFWLCFGPNDQTQMRREQMDEQFEQLAQWLLYGIMDFDYLSESMLPTLSPQLGYPLRVGECAYETVLVPPMITLRKSTRERLEAFRHAGGTLIFLGDPPTLEDGVPSDAPGALARESVCLPMERCTLMETLQPQRDVTISDAQTGRLSDNLFCQLRQDGAERTLFLCHVRNETPALPRTYIVRLRGLWRMRVMNALDGTTKEQGGVQTDAYTTFRWFCDAQDSLLLRLSPGVCAAPDTTKKAYKLLQKLSAADEYALDEPNALLLDHCAYALDDEPWREEEHILRADNLLRARAGLPMRDGDQVQPWMTPHEKPAHTVRLRYRFQSQRAFSGLSLALEQPENAEIELNGEPVSNKPEALQTRLAHSDECIARDWFVDSAIRTLPLPPIREGENTLLLRMPLTRRTNLEWMYLLGEFGANVCGQTLTLTDKPDRLVLDDLTRQGLPFYTGNTRYLFHIAFDRDMEHVCVRVPHTAASVIRIFLDGVSIGVTAWQPYRVQLPPLCAGKHLLEVLAYGNRYNAFGTLHNANPDYKWYGPAAYRTTGDEWTDCYRLRPSGIQSPIELEEAQECI